ncbi:hypothetical protein [uncultured Sphingomonas sp.]|uniref:hypothetical protein n=1 Tax=uncultured Sphingomonas sp. TaxID=158754 RepID=UPI0025DAB555|nr:hypothetical protein [uncultured Sphingomonas sp.]
MIEPVERAVQLPELMARLGTHLSQADDEAFLRMLWTLNALQSGREDVARRFLNGYPPDAATDGILGPHAIYPWELETLANELLTTEKGPYRIFNCRDWNAIGSLVNRLRAVENAEFGVRRAEVNIFVEMGRIGARQFPWQRGYAGIPSLYRNAYIYGQGECAAYLQQAHNLTLSDMTLVGFSLFAVFYAEPAIRPAIDMRAIHEFGISSDAFHRTLDRISRPIESLKREASTLRNVGLVTAYKPSVLRQYPCIQVGHRGRVLVAPLPDLIMDRVTNGLFYDVVGGGGPVREEIGQRFEAYSLALLRETLDARFEPEATYRTRLGAIATPDVLMCGEDGGVTLAIECKASRMSVAARFGDVPEADRGYEEIAKGVMQLWRFFAHCRQGIAPNRLAPDAQGMVLTMDEWFAGRSTVIPQIMARANELADASAHEIPAEDRRAVAFCTVSELENVLITATPSSLAEAVQIGSGDRAGWIFSILHAETAAGKTAPRNYPFEEALNDLLPWHARLAGIARDGSLSEAYN